MQFCYELRTKSLSQKKFLGQCGTNATQGLIMQCQLCDRNSYYTSLPLQLQRTILIYIAVQILYKHSA